MRRSVHPKFTLILHVMLNPVFSAYKLWILWNAAPAGQMQHLQCLLYELADKSSHWDNSVLAELVLTAFDWQVFTKVSYMKFYSQDSQLKIMLKNYQSCLSLCINSKNCWASGTKQDILWDTHLSLRRIWNLKAN